MDMDLWSGSIFHPWIHIHFPSMDTHPFSIHGFRIRIHFPSMDRGSGSISIHGSRSIFNPWIQDPDPFSIHGSRIRIYFPSMDRESAYIFHPWIQDQDPRLNELILTTLTMQFLRILKLFVFFFWGILLGFFCEKN